MKQQKLYTKGRVCEQCIESIRELMHDACYGELCEHDGLTKCKIINHKGREI